MQSVLDAAFEALKESGETRITEITLTVGEQTDIQEIPLNFAFEALKQNTAARNAALKVTMLGTRSQCNDCATEFDHDRFSMLCSDCGSTNITLLTGRELRIDGMDVDCEPFDDGEDDPYAQIVDEMRADAPAMPTVESAADNNASV